MKKSGKHYVFELVLLELLKNMCFFYVLQPSGSNILQQCEQKNLKNLICFEFFCWKFQKQRVFHTFFSHRRATCWKTLGFASFFAGNVKNNIGILTIFLPRILRARSDI